MSPKAKIDPTIEKLQFESRDITKNVVSENSLSTRYALRFYSSLSLSLFFLIHISFYPSSIFSLLGETRRGNVLFHQLDAKKYWGKNRRSRLRRRKWCIVEAKNTNNEREKTRWMRKHTGHMYVTHTHTHDIFSLRLCSTVLAAH